MVRMFGFVAGPSKRINKSMFSEEKTKNGRILAKYKLIIYKRVVFIWRVFVLFFIIRRSGVILTFLVSVISKFKQSVSTRMSLIVNCVTTIISITMLFSYTLQEYKTTGKLQYLQYGKREYETIRQREKKRRKLDLFVSFLIRFRVKRLYNITKYC